ncbi:heavy-metal-associated domain-containing protein [Actinoallomurus acaciae]|uniref:Heavy-metal-associated domain-containing protein n=1 Tax=Actinoallomurus acaciae TaxID=502577 RepID=A0ABV5Y898_9ACTN
MTTTQYKVKGMTCDHCVSAVTAEVGAIDGVTDVKVDLASGVVTVASATPLDDQSVRAAVDEAGYEVAGS